MCVIKLKMKVCYLFSSERNSNKFDFDWMVIRHHTDPINIGKLARPLFYNQRKAIVVKVWNKPVNINQFQIVVEQDSFQKFKT